MKEAERVSGTCAALMAGWGWGVGGDGGKEEKGEKEEEVTVCP